MKLQFKFASGSLNGLTLGERPSVQINTRANTHTHKHVHAVYIYVLACVHVADFHLTSVIFIVAKKRIKYLFSQRPSLRLPNTVTATP